MNLLGKPFLRLGWGCGSPFPASTLYNRTEGKPGPTSLSNTATETTIPVRRAKQPCVPLASAVAILACPRTVGTDEQDNTAGHKGPEGRLPEPESDGLTKRSDRSFRSNPPPPKMLPGSRPLGAFFWPAVAMSLYDFGQREQKSTAQRLDR